MRSATERKTVVGVFGSREEAQHAINALKRAGFTDDQIGVTSRNGTMTGAEGGQGAANETYAGEGAATGLAAGAGVGALWGLAVLSGMLPAIGPAIAGGTMAALLSSAAAGAAAAGIAGTLVGMGISKEEAEYYEGEVKAGRTIVTVNTDQRDQVLSIFRTHGGYIRPSSETHSSHSVLEPTASSSTAPPVTAPVATSTSGPSTSGSGTRGSGALGTTGAAPGSAAHVAAESCSSKHVGSLATASGRQSATAAASSRGSALAAGAPGNTIRAHEEELHVDKHREQVGDVSVRKEVKTEHKTIDVPVEREEVVIERHPASGQAAADSIGDQQREIRIPVSEEHVDVQKTPVVKEEVTVGKRKVTENKRVSDTVRKEQIKVESSGDAKVRDERR